MRPNLRISLYMNVLRTTAGRVFTVLLNLKSTVNSALPLTVWTVEHSYWLRRIWTYCAPAVQSQASRIAAPSPVPSVSHALKDTLHLLTKMCVCKIFAVSKGKSQQRRAVVLQLHTTVLPARVHTHQQAWMNKKYTASYASQGSKCSLVNVKLCQIRKTA